MSKRLFLSLSAIVITLIILPSYIRAYVVVGDSDAPAYVTGDRVIVNLSAYDFKLPYTDDIIKHLKNPSAGDYVLFRHHGGTLMFKRIVAVPGNTIEMIDNRLIINGKQLQYQKIDTRKATELPFRTQLGSVIERETGNGDDIFISYTQGTISSSTFAQKSSRKKCILSWAQTVITARIHVTSDMFHETEYLVKWLASFENDRVFRPQTVY